jgi:hypothetical protein
MSHASGKLAECLHLLALDELRFQILEFRDVVQDRDEVAVLGRPGQVEGDPDDGVLARIGAAEELGTRARSARRNICDPVADRPPQAFDQIGKPRSRADRSGEQIPSLPRGVQEFPVA